MSRLSGQTVRAGDFQNENLQIGWKIPAIGCIVIREEFSSQVGATKEKDGYAATRQGL
jgi:hypothetical protein